MAEQGLTIISALNSQIEFSNDGGASWVEIPFTGDIEASGGEAPTNEVVTFRRVGTVVGHERIPGLTVQVPSYIPHHSSWRALAAANLAGSELQFRIRTIERERAQSGAGNTAAIATTGMVTLNPLVSASPAHSIDWRSELYGIGLGIKVGANILTVDTISAVGVLTVNPSPAAAIAAAVYSVVQPRLRLGPFLARITTLAPFNLPAEGQLNTTLGLQPVTRLPAWGID